MRVLLFLIVSITIVNGYTIKASTRADFDPYACNSTWIGDGYCDDYCNTDEYNWDGGDCCDNKAKGWDQYCGMCDCKIQLEDCLCGQKREASRIVGGTDTDEYEYPWQVAITDIGCPATMNRILCSGSLISDRYVLTSAKCTEGKSASDIMVHYRKYKTENDKYAFMMNVAKIINHPDYDTSAGIADNDYSILELNKAIEFNDKVQPVCLPENADSDYIGAAATASGWGSFGYSGGKPNVLQEVDLQVLANDNCGNYVQNDITGNMLCASVDEGGKGTCYRDNGGPLVTLENNAYTLIGVINNGLMGDGYGCGKEDYPALFARVTAQLDWIKSNTQDSTFCPRPSA